MALCKFPMYLKTVGGLAPCGRCFTCRLNKARFWTFRLMMEAHLHSDTWWTTITYNPQFEPQGYIDKKTGQVFEGRTLDPYQIELLIKRLRKWAFPQSFRYFLVGEYGDTNLRPHYHICFFGLGENAQAGLRHCWTDPISRLPIGLIDRDKCGPITQENARYTCGYTLKKLTKKNDPLLEGRYPEFIRSSKGIGLEFAKRFAASINNPSGLQHILTTGDIPRSVRYDGRYWPLDRYMRDKILEELGIRDVLLEKGKERFSQEMRALSHRAELNQKFSPSVGSMSPFVLQSQYVSETHQKVLNTEKRAKLKMKDRDI